MKAISRRQTTRRALLFTSLLLFPLTINYLSPYIIIDGASQGIVNGSMIVFALMFLGSLFFGRVWCGWACPAGGLAEAGQYIVNKPAPRQKLDWIKWLVWAIWLGVIAAAAISAGGYRAINPFHLTESIISIDRVYGFIIYYIVIATFLIPSLLIGRRAGCHAFCWMAPFMILGRKLRNRFAWPALRLQADASRCKDCKTCTSTCPMSLDVNAMVRKQQMEHSECILCGTCADGCPARAIRFAFQAGK